ncbi:MAG: anti-sigma factor [Alphaproteobacteria bacterium]|nr:anti-sigma factor [Alphaproteobacteria bacterium]
MTGFDDRTLGAYVDGELSIDEARFVDIALSSDAGLRARIAAIREATLAARAAFASVEREAVPEHLLITVRQGAPKTRVFPLPGVNLYHVRGHRFAIPIAVAASVTVVAGLGVLASGLIGSDPANQVAYEDSWLDQVRQSYEGYADIGQEDSPALVDADGASGGEQLGAWFGDQLNRQREVPDLSSHGLTLKGGRLIIVAGKPSAQFLYVSETGSPVALSVVPSTGRDQLISAQGGDKANLLHWRARNYGYALIGNLTLDTMRDLANEIAPRRSPAT